MNCKTCENMQTHTHTHTTLDELFNMHENDSLLQIDIYNVYSIYEGAIDAEESFKTLDQAYDYFNELIKDAEQYPNDEISVYLYDLISNQIVAEITV